MERNGKRVKKKLVMDNVEKRQVSKLKWLSETAADFLLKELFSSSSFFPLSISHLYNFCDEKTTQKMKPTVTNNYQKWQLGTKEGSYDGG